MDNYKRKSGLSDGVKNYIIIAIILIGVTVFSIINGPTDTLLSIEDDFVSITGINDETLVINYDDITTLEALEPLPDLGEAVNVVESGKVISGTYKNEAYGEYQVHLNTGIDACVLVRTDDVTVIFNIESVETTKELCSAFQKYIDGTI